MTNRVFIIIFSLLLYLSGHAALITRYEPLINFFFVTSWWAYIILLDTLLSRKTKKFALLNRHLPGMIIISCGYWCFFEIMNLRLQDWYYINIPYNAIMRYVGYFLAYGTVIPAICLTAQALEPVLPHLRTRPFSVPNYFTRACLAGSALFVLALAVPEYFFGLTWVFGILVIDGFNYRAGRRSFMADLEHGDPRRVLTALLAGLICGAIWEAWNFLSPVRWVYTVPFLEHFKVFEMPIAGYIGFPVFAVETIAFFDLFEGMRKSGRAIIMGIAILLSAVSFPLIDRHTVFSFTAPIENMGFLTDRDKEMLLRSGARTNISIDPDKIGPSEAMTLALVNLKGLGYDNYLKLKASDAAGVKALKDMKDTELARILGQRNLRRMHVYQEAAKRFEY